MGLRCARIGVLLGVVLVIGCGSDSDDPAPAQPDAGNPPPDGGTTCAPGELPIEGGGCKPPGVPADACGAGFTPDGASGCVATLPAAPCGPGWMAVPGETACHEVAPCGDGTWGDIPVDASTQHVDAEYLDGGSDGSPAKPWTNLEDALLAATRGAIVALAAGSYAGDIQVEGKPVRMWGRCPAMVEIVGTAAALAALSIRKGADGSEVRDLAITGGAIGAVVTAGGVLLDGVWVHDTARRAVSVEGVEGAADVTLRSCLIEGSKELGIFVAANAEATVESSVVRDVNQLSGQFGWGLAALDADGSRPRVQVRGSVLEHNREYGAIAKGSDLALEASLVRGTQLAAVSGAGRGLAAEDDADTGERASLAVMSSVVEGNAEHGIYVSGGDLTVEATVVRDTQPGADGTLGTGIRLDDSSPIRTRSTLVMRSSLVERSHFSALSIFGSDANVESSIFRDTAAQAADGTWGRGLEVIDSPWTQAGSVLEMRGSVIARNQDVAMLVVGSKATVEWAAFLETAPRPADQRYGRGIGVQAGAAQGVLGELVLRDSLIEGSHEIGLYVGGSNASVERCTIRNTQPDALGFGDGITVLALGPGSATTVSQSRIEGSTRAGIASFSAHVSLSACTLECNGIALDGETVFGPAFHFEDLGGNTCACSGQEESCQVLTSALEPPGAVLPPDPK